MESRSKSRESKKSAIKQETIPDVNMEDSPPVSDSDVSIKICVSTQNTKENR